ncbi:MAG: hypothetical protein O3B47_00505 [bacterium]|nr:hypothetical protein [bacterium]
MPIFKYTVSNKDGKKLSGSVEAPDEATAREELGQLGFTIINLNESEEKEDIKEGHSKFVFEAIDKNSKLVTGTIPSKDESEAFQKLKTEYDLNVSAIWKEGATEQEIKDARTKGTQNLQAQITTDQSKEDEVTKKQEEAPEEENLVEQKQIEFTKAKIEEILKQVNILLQNFDKEIGPDNKAEINKKIDKLLRIKNSTNTDYILTTAEELLKFIQDQEKNIIEKDHEGKKFEFQLQTKQLLDNLNQSGHKKSISEDITEKIESWQKEHITSEEKTSGGAKFVNSFLSRIKDAFTTPPEIIAIKEEIKGYNKQIWQLIQLYFKEPTPEYKDKVKNSIKCVWEKRKNTKIKLANAKKTYKDKQSTANIEENLLTSFIQELNALTGWLLAFYVIYYFAALYLKTKDFGLPNIPEGLLVYDSKIFKYVLVTLFLLHMSTALKVNFFKKSFLANIVLFPVFLFGTIITLLNF